MLLYAITDRTLLGGGADGEDERFRLARLLELAREWAAGGVDFLQVREKDLDPEALCSLTRSIMEAVRGVPGSRTRVLLNAGTAEHRAACAGCGQDGLHLAGGQWTGARPRRGAGGADGWLSVACHSPEEVRAARKAGADLALFAPVFEKQLGDASALAGVGLDALAEACRVAGEMPVIALGGVTAGNAADCLLAGAAGVAGIRLFLEGPSETAPGWLTLRRGADQRPGSPA